MYEAYRNIAIEKGDPLSHKGRDDAAKGYSKEFVEWFFGWLPVNYFKSIRQAAVQDDDKDSEEDVEEQELIVKSDS